MEDRERAMLRSCGCLWPQDIGVAHQRSSSNLSFAGTACITVRPCDLPAFVRLYHRKIAFLAKGRFCLAKDPLRVLRCVLLIRSTSEGPPESGKQAFHRIQRQNLSYSQFSSKPR